MMDMFFFDAIFPVLFSLTFFAVLSVFIVTAVLSISRWHKNNNSPKLSVPATVVAKRTQHHHSARAGRTYGRATYYYATFEFDSGDRLELHIPGSEIGLLVEGDMGILTFQGTRFINFDRTK